MNRRTLRAALAAAEEALDAANTAHAETRRQLIVQTNRADVAVHHARDVLREKHGAQLALIRLLSSPRCLPVIGERADGIGPSPIYDALVMEVAS